MVIHNTPRTTFLIAIGFLSLITLTKHLVGHINSFANICFILVYFYEIYLPFILIHRFRQNPFQYALHAYGAIEHYSTKLLNLFIKPPSLLPPFQKNFFKRDIHFTLLLSAWSLPLFALVSFGIQSYLAMKQGLSCQLHLAFTPNLLAILLNETIFVALPEEIFFRGFLQKRFLREWPRQFFLFGLPLGKAILLTNLFFALAHFLGEYHLFRLLTFFPGIIFSWLTYRSNSILGATLYHGLCNTLSQTLAAVYIWQS